MAHDVSPLFSTLQRTETLASRVTEHLETLIIERHLQPGDRLPSERELAAQTGVSRTVIREAVRSLVAKSLLEVKPGSGTLIKAPSAQTVTQSVLSFVQVGQPNFDPSKIHEVRRVLETEIAGYAAERRSKADLERIHSFILQMEQSREDRVAFSGADVAFHKALAEATHNELFVILLDSIAGVMFRVRELGNRLRSAPQHAIAHHKRIYKAVKASDPAAAKAAMLAHLFDSEAIFNKAVTELEEGS